MPDNEHWEDRSRDALYRGVDGISLSRASQLREAGDLDGSLRMLQKLVAADMRRQGRMGCDTQCAMSQLGRTLRVMGRVAEARDLHEEVLAIRIEYYGRFDSFTLNSANILADTLDMLNDHEMVKAVRLWRRPPKAPSAIDLEAIMRVDARLNGALARGQANVAQRVAALIRDYLGHPVPTGNPPAPSRL